MRRHAALRDFADLVEELDGAYVTAQDVGVSEDDLTYIAAHTAHAVGRPRAHGGAGDPSPHTAMGVDVALRASLRHATGDARPLGRTVVVLGLGHVGSALAARLHRAGARLVVSDIDPGRRALADRLGARWVAPQDALDVEADVFAPCALGGVLDDEAVARLRAPVVAGAANNQLAHDAVADALRERGVLWAPDFVANAGGLIAVADELHGFDPDRVRRAVHAIGGTLDAVFARARAAGTTTLAAAYALASDRISDQED
jgi:leucine dehydrogenase